MYRGPAVTPLVITEVGDRRFFPKAHLETELHHAVVAVELSRQVAEL
jgi:hypothetical protein